MNREMQQKAIRELLKEIGVKGIKIVDCNKLHNVNERYIDCFIAFSINTAFYCTENETEINGKIFNDCSYYRVVYKNMYIYFSASFYMKGAIENQDKIKVELIVKH